MRIVSRKRLFVVIALLLAATAVGYVLWPRLSFWRDRVQIEALVAELGDPDGGADHPRVTVQKAPPLEARDAERATAEISLAGHTFTYPEHEFEPEELGRDRWRLESEDLRMGIFDSAVNPALTVTPEKRRVFSRRSGGRAILGLHDSTSRFELLKQIYQSHPDDIDTATGLDDKYVSLYLSTLRSVLLPSTAGRAVTEVHTPTARCLVAGDLKDGRVIVDMQCKQTDHFFTLILEPRPDREHPDIAHVLANISLRPATDTPETGP